MDDFVVGLLLGHLLGGSGVLFFVWVSKKAGLLAFNKEAERGP